MISIVICTYNDSEFLADAIMSCLCQNVEREIIVVDDCSTKPIVPEVITIINDYKIKYIKHDKNAGLSQARNTGIKYAKYDLIIPLDSDDRFAPNSISELYDQVEDGYSVFYGNILCAGNISKPKMFPFKREEILVENPIFSSSLFRKQMWEDVGGYKVREGAHYEDWNFWLRALIKDYKFKYVDTMVYEHVERADSMLRTLAKNKQYYVDVATEEFRKI